MALRTCQCGVQVCDIRVDGEWRLGDWPPVVPVVDFSRMVVAFDGHYHVMEGEEVKPDFTSYDAFRIGAPPAPMLVQIHECEATVRYRGYMTDAGRRKFEEFERQEGAHEGDAQGSDGAAHDERPDRTL